LIKYVFLGRNKYTIVKVVLNQHPLKTMEDFYMAIQGLVVPITTNRPTLYIHGCSR